MENNPVSWINIWINQVFGDIISYFTNLNLAAIKGDDFPPINHDSSASSARENSEVKANDHYWLVVDLPL